MKHYSTGAFAQRANVTIRTVRYYDKVGLLKPTFVASNGYRQYTDQDFIKLQKILSLKHLGFSLQEIFPLVSDDDSDAILESLDMQLDLINKRINRLQLLKDSLKSTKDLVKGNQLEWNKIIELIQLSNKDELIADEYKSSKNLNARIRLHKECSIASEDWFVWVYKQIDLCGVNRLLEVGCGNGQLWKQSNPNIRNREIYLSDISEGMIDDARKALGDEYSYFTFRCEDIPFQSEFFDSVIANHILFYLKDVDKGLEQIAKVLKKQGCFYCTTYSANHMKEINELVHEFDSHIILSEDTLYERFGVENGKAILEKYFVDVEWVSYEDGLEIKQWDVLYDYIVSCYGNQNEIIGNRLNELKFFLKAKIEKQGMIQVTKEAGIFRCKKS